jgi:hypothetical protein
MFDFMEVTSFVTFVTDILPLWSKNMRHSGRFAPVTRSQKSHAKLRFQ